MKITVLDSKTLGKDLDLSVLNALGEVAIYDTCNEDNIKERIKDTDVIINNKLKLSENELSEAKNLKLICLAATGYDPVDVKYCKKRNIGVCNVCGYSSNSVSQLTVTMALALISHLPEYIDYTRSGEYTRSKTANHVSPVFNEIDNLTWGIIGLGNIGKKVAKAAECLGCNVIAYKRTKEEGYNLKDLDTLLKTSDIISVHLPLTDETRNLISREKIALMKEKAIFINVARGAVSDEQALAEAIKNNKIAGIGIDVYSEEPFSETHPFYEIKEYPNVIFTPHMSWGAYESRNRCINEIILNINAFFKGEIRNRVDLYE